MKFGFRFPRALSRPNKYTSLGISILLIVILVSILFSMFFMGGSGRLEGFKEGLRKGNKFRKRDLSTATPQPDETEGDNNEENMVENMNRPTEKNKKEDENNPMNPMNPMKKYPTKKQNPIKTEKKVKKEKKPTSNPDEAE